MTGTQTNDLDGSGTRRGCLDCGALLPSEYPGHVCVNCLLGEEDPVADGAAAGSAAVLRVPGHDVLEELARGGMGIVYKAWDRSSARCVALKMLRPQLGDDADMVARFRLEARTLASLQHEAILPVYRVDENDDLPFFTMKFAAGGTLADRRGTYAGRWRAIAELVAEVAGAVQYAHSRGVLHRDIKPGNILFDDEGRAYLSDFGLVKMLDGAQSLAASRHFLGTPHYASPEVAGANAGSATVASDIWSLGAVLYELLSGQRPFDGDGVPTLLRRIVEDPAPPLTAEVPGDLAVICLKCLAKSPDQRYHSAEELAADLRAWLSGRPIRARPTGRVERVGRWARRNPGTALLGSGLAAALLLLAAALWRQSLTDRALLRESLARETEGRATRLLDDVRFRMQSAPWLDHPALLARIKESLAMRPTAEGRELLATLLATPSLSRVRTIQASPDRRWAARPSGDLKECVVIEGGGCAILDVATGQRRRRVEALPVPNYPPGPLSPDGRWLMITGRRDTRLYDTVSGVAVLTLPRCSPIYSHFSGDGTRLFATRNGHRGMLVCDLVPSPPRVVAFPENLGAVKVLAVSADGRLLATMKSESAPTRFDLVIHDARTGERLCEPEMSDGAPVHMAAFSPDSTCLYAVMINGRMAAWQVADRAPLWITEGHASGADSVAVFESGRALVTQGRDDMTRFWNAATGREIFAAPWRGRAVHASPAGDRIMLELADSLASVVMEFKPAAACAAVEVPLSSTPSYNTFEQGRSSLAFAPDGMRLVVTTGHNVFQVARAEGQNWRVIEGSEIQCGRSGELVPDFAGGSILQAAVGGVRRLPMEGGNPTEAAAPGAWEIRSPEILPWFVVDGLYGGLFAWHRNWHGFRGADRPDSAPLTLLPDGALTQCAAFAGDGRLWWVGQCIPRAGAPWQMHGFRPDGGRAMPGEPLALLPAGERPQAMAVAEEGSSILVLTDKSLRSIARDGTDLWHIPCQNRPPESAAGLAVGAGAHLVATTLRPEVVTLLDVRSGHVLLDLRRQGGGAIRALALSPDGRTLVALSGRQADFWDLDVLRDHGALAATTGGG
jgi:hypothetical protein